MVEGSIKEAIILAGGLGTRLKEAVPDLPKAMAPVAGKPFISYVIDYFRMQGVQHFVFSLGYKAEVIQEYLNENYSTLDFTIALEDDPLGTGGAIKLALLKTKTDNVLVTNADTLFKINLQELSQYYNSRKAECVLALKPMKSFERYGVVEKDEEGKVVSFKEKNFYEEGLINGGVYLLNKKFFLHHSFPEKFSFEKDYLEKYFKEEKIYGVIQDEYFIDIGIPEDFKKANNDLQPASLDLKEIDGSWSLFLDRDGVINEEKVGNYILNWDEFIFNNGALEAIKILGKRFGKVFIISNQRGVGRNLMSEEDLLSIHKEMQKEIEATGGRVDDIYYCTDTDNKSFNRKPNPGLAFQVTKDYPSVDLSKSIMVGNKPTDMRFGRAAGMFTVFVKTTNPDQPFPHPDIDLCFPSLFEFSKAL